MVLLSIGLFSLPPHDHINRMGNVHTCITWSCEQKWDCTPWLLGVPKYFLGLLGFCPFWFLSLGFLSYSIFVHWAFLCPATWSYEQNLDCAHLYNVISWTEMGLYSLIVGVLNYFLFCCFCPLWFLSFGAFVLWCFCAFGLLSVRLRDHMNRMLIVLICIAWSHEQKWDCTPWLLEY